MMQSSSALAALVSAQTAPIARTIARRLGLWLLILAIFLAISPWQQNVRGSGRVIAYVPADRQQTISAPVEGRISHWLVQEGSVVKSGQILAEIQDNDPQLLQRLATERETLLQRQQAIDSRVLAFEQQLQLAEQARPQALMAAESRLSMAKQRQIAASQSLDAAKAARETAQLNATRQTLLQQKGLASRRSYELAQLDIAQRSAEAERAQASWQAAKSEVQAINADLQKLVADSQGSIEKTRADLTKAIEDKNYIIADLQKIDTRLARQQTQTLLAPRDGTVLRLLANPGAELLKSGQPVAILVPDTQQRAVELWVDGNDLPLIVRDCHVRLQFEGYPAIQFGGWPEFSVGSFGGQVALIDATDDGKGHFRIVVVPDNSDIDWPEARFLRQGVRVNGWVLLGQVSLGYELWRIFNGFPPQVLPEPGMGYSKDGAKDAKSDSNDKKD